MATETTLPTRLRIVELKQQKQTHAQVGAELDLSESCVKKHWCRFRRAGLPGLQRRSRRPKRLHPDQTPQAVRDAILDIKKQHPGWGGQFIQGELRRRHFKTIPQRRTIERYLNQFPDLPKRRYRQHVALQDSRRATRWHQLWQIDFKVKEKLKRARRTYSFLNMRDRASTASILKYTLPKGRSDLTSQEVIGVCQQAFQKWHCLPEAIRTDNGTCFAAHAPTSFPTDFTLYLWGLGVEHERIDERRPTQNGGVERDQRTFGEHFVRDYVFHGERALSQDAEAFGEFQTRFVPSRAVRCLGQTAQQVAAHLECRARPYQAKHESKLFDVQRIFAKLAHCTWQRQADRHGAIQVGHFQYYVGRKYVRQQLQVDFDVHTHELVACTPEQGEVKRWPIRGISYSEIVQLAKKPRTTQKRRKKN